MSALDTYGRGRSVPDPASGVVGAGAVLAPGGLPGGEAVHLPLVVHHELPGPVVGVGAEGVVLVGGDGLVDDRALVGRPRRVGAVLGEQGLEPAAVGGGAGGADGRRAEV